MTRRRSRLKLLPFPRTPSSSLQTSMRPDRVNSAPWGKACTNLLNDVRQTFESALARLVAVEVELALANLGPSESFRGARWLWI